MTPTNFFAAFRVTFLMPRVCFKSITWYIKVHHVKTFFLCGVVTFSCYVTFIRNMFIFKKLTVAFVCRRTVRMDAIYQLKIKNMIRTSSECFSLDAKCPVSFPFEDKHAVNEHHTARKSHDTTQKNMSSRGAKVPRDWFETNLRHKKHYSKGGKNIRGCRGLLGRVIKLYCHK